MDKKFVLYAIEVEEVMLSGDYGSDYEPITESRATLRDLCAYDTEEKAIKGIEDYRMLSKEFTILPIYIV